MAAGRDLPGRNGIKSLYPPLFRGHRLFRKGEEDIPFTEVCIYQVHPQKVDAFEAVLREAKPFLEQQQGLLQLRFIKQGYRIDLEEIKEGLPPPALTRIVKSVKYLLYWEFDTKESYGAAQKNLYNSYWKAIERCLIAPHDKYLGEVLF